MFIYGVHAARSVLNGTKHKPKKIFVQSRKMFDWIDPAYDKITTVLKEQDFAKYVSKDAVHQGVVVEIDSDELYSDLDDLKDINGNYAICILDQISDPQNLGAIIRSAAVFGIKGIVIPEKNSAKLNPVVFKSASGGLEHVDIYLVKNISQAIEKLQSYGFWIVSLSEKGTQSIDDIDLSGKICVMLGSEGDGIRSLPLKKSDFVVKLNSSETGFSTLNVSNAAAVVFHEIFKKQR